MDDFLHNYQRRKPSLGALDHVSCSNYKDVHGNLRAAIQNGTMVTMATWLIWGFLQIRDPQNERFIVENPII
jgi:hypothetical protein